jgi:hypothetical protein
MSLDQHPKSYLLVLEPHPTAPASAPIRALPALHPQAALLRGLGCPEMQGFLFSRPRTAAELLADLRG